ncbi:MAG: NUDIX domain-containing protein [Prevotellaceae bacterium]|jgi:isopentenyldiphosphate isomerase|nr:NUDIX domain-containing protein [Prevotellaceae bacterium]
MSSQAEIFPLVDASGRVTGKATRAECHSGSMLLHPVVHLHYFNAQGELYLQKRAAHKDIQPNMWDTSVGGHVSYGEEVAAALLREASEELGLRNICPVFLFRYVFESDVERELVYVYYATSPALPQPDHDEVSEGRFWSVEEILTSLGKNIFTPNFEGEIKRALSALRNVSTLHFHRATTICSFC